MNINYLTGFKYLLAIYTISLCTEFHCNGQDEKLTAQQRLPDAIIFGSKKSGTGALLEFLNQHPDINACKHEIHFFDKNYSLGLKWYLNQMPFALNNQIIIEKTPAYFVDHDIPARVYEMSHNIKLLLIVKNPVTRLISDYTQGCAKKNRKVGDFEKRVLINDSRINISSNLVKTGQYADHLTAWLDYFPMEQIHIISGEELIANPVKVLQNIEKFLKLKPVVSENHFYFDPNKGFYCLKKYGNSPGCLDKSKGRTHVKISPYVKNLLVDYYRGYNEKFFKMTGRDFGWNA